jgi:DNA-binding transcriptional MerR regulator
VARLQQVRSLKQLGFGLEQIREYLSRADYDPRHAVEMHLGTVRGQAAELKRLESRLSARPWLIPRNLGGFRALAVNHV